MLMVLSNNQMDESTDHMKPGLVSTTPTQARLEMASLAPSRHQSGIAQQGAFHGQHSANNHYTCSTVLCDTTISHSAFKPVRYCTSRH